MAALSEAPYSDIATTAVDAPRADDEYVEFLASELCAATLATPHPWAVCEIWRATGEAPGWGPAPPVPSPPSPSRSFEEEGPPSVSPPPAAAGDGSLQTLSLVFGAGAKRGCYSPMRAPRGHACARCLEDPTARMLRVASHFTFSPGIGLVGRVYMLGVAEVVDLPAIGASSTYARQAAALGAGVQTAVALPVVPPAAEPGAVRTASAVVIVYFGDRLVHLPAGGGGTAAQATLCALLDGARRAAKRGPAAPAPRVARTPGGWRAPVEASAEGARPRSDPTRSSGSDRRFARKLAASLAGGAAGGHQCPVCFGCIETAARVVGCAHAACAECLARWRVTSDRCPVCEGPADAVERDLALDAQIAGDRAAAVRAAPSLSF